MIDKIQQLKKIKNQYDHHTTEADKIPAITKDLYFHYLDWLYDDNKINVRAKDYILIALIQEVINVYLEDTDAKEADKHQQELWKQKERKNNQCKIADLKSANETPDKYGFTDGYIHEEFTRHCKYEYIEGGKIKYTPQLPGDYRFIIFDWGMSTRLIFESLNNIIYDRKDDYWVILEFNYSVDGEKKKYKLEFNKKNLLEFSFNNDG